ncbi:MULTISPECIES: hypothetical protein [Microbacterium]|uniref:hypothetical protein n=1 Tax=Microbacterium TaxID=33882 RepID=UPI0027D7CE57|nr:MULTISPECIES: hypothetical protein [Microbacterium]
MSRDLLTELLPEASFVSRCSSCGGDHGRIRVLGADAAVSVSYVPGWAVVAVTREHVRIGIDAVPADAAGLERVLPGVRARVGADAVSAGAAGMERVLPDVRARIGADAVPTDAEGIERVLPGVRARIGTDAVPADAGGIERVPPSVRVRIGAEALPADAAGIEQVLPDAADARAWARTEAVLKADGRGLSVDPGRIRVVADAEGWTASISPRSHNEQGRARNDDECAPVEWRGWDLEGPEGVVAALVVR